MQFRNGECEDVDECSSSCKNNCDYLHGVCTNEPGFYTCSCMNGYTGSGINKDCQDLDECLYGVYKCQENAYCSNTIGSYTCNCISGFYNNGTYCEGIRKQTVRSPLLDSIFSFFSEINECLAEESQSFCGPNSHCVNIIGSYICECDIGYRYNVSTCQDINECADDTNPPCNSPNTQCVNRMGGYDCICSLGLTWSNELKNCIDVDECDIKTYKFQVCESNSICENTFGSYLCACKQGWLNTDTNSCAGEYLDRLIYGNNY